MRVKLEQYAALPQVHLQVRLQGSVLTENDVGMPQHVQLRLQDLYDVDQGHACNTNQAWTLRRPELQPKELSSVR